MAPILSFHAPAWNAYSHDNEILPHLRYRQRLFWSQTDDFGHLTGADWRLPARLV